MALLTLYPEDQADAEWTTRDADDIAGWLKRIGVVYERVQPAADGSAVACSADGAEHVHEHAEHHRFDDGVGALHLRAGGRVYLLLGEPGDAVTVPAGMPHWLDRGDADESPTIAEAAIVRRFPKLAAYRPAL